MGFVATVEKNENGYTTEILSDYETKKSGLKMVAKEANRLLEEEQGKIKIAKDKSVIAVETWARRGHYVLFAYLDSNKYRINTSELFKILETDEVYLFD